MGASGVKRCALRILKSCSEATRSSVMLWGIVFLAKVGKGSEFGTETVKGGLESKDQPSSL